MLYYLSNIIINENADIQNFKVKSTKNYNKITCYVYSNSDRIDDIDNISSVKLSIKLYKNKLLPGIINFGKYKLAIEEYEAKRFYFNLLNRMFFNINTSATDNIADKIINDEIKNEAIKKSGLLAKSYDLGAIEEGPMEEAPVPMNMEMTATEGDDVAVSSM
jgi:hypothetical protein